MNIKIDIKQLKKLEKQLLKAGPKTTRHAQLELKATAFDTLATAKILAKVDKGHLQGAMAMEPITKEAYKIGNNKDYAPYVEFGTGLKVSTPAEWNAFALQFKSPKEAGAALRNGQHAQPFLYPAFKEGRKLLVKRVTQVIKDFKLK